MRLLVVAKSGITKLNLLPMRSIDVLLAFGSVLRVLLTGSTTKLKIVDVSDTLMDAFPISCMSELLELQFQGSMIGSLDLK